jgi:hypothetical protein
LKDVVKPRLRDKLGVKVEAPDELKTLLDLAHKQARADGIPVYVLVALQRAIRETVKDVEPPPRPEALPPWKPKSAQVWTSDTKRPDGRRLSAWQFFQGIYGETDLSDRPFASQIRGNPRTKPWYDALCVYVSKNKARGLQPSSISDLFPIAGDRGDEPLARASARQRAARRA